MPLTSICTTVECVTSEYFKTKLKASCSLWYTCRVPLCRLPDQKVLLKYRFCTVSHLTLQCIYWPCTPYAHIHLTNLRMLVNNFLIVLLVWVTFICHCHFVYIADIISVYNYTIDLSCLITLKETLHSTSSLMDFDETWAQWSICVGPLMTNRKWRAKVI